MHPVDRTRRLGFVVATRRTRTAGKADIPKVDDHVSRLEHMGKETVKKLFDLKVAAECVSVALDLPPGIPNCIQRAGEFKQLVQCAEQDGVLCLSKTSRKKALICRYIKTEAPDGAQTQQREVGRSKRTRNAMCRARQSNASLVLRSSQP